MNEKPHIAPPIFSEGIDLSRKHTKHALERMDRFIIPSVPPNFHVWYEYSSDRNPDLKRAIDQLIASREPFTPELCASLFQKFIRDLSPDPVTDEVTRQLIQTLTHLRTALSEASTNSDGINDELRQVADQINSASGHELVSIAAALRNTAERMTKLNATLRNRVQNSTSEIDDLQRNLRVAREAASRDGVTGIGNRQFFDATLARLMAEARSEGASLTLALVDVDHFKAFNDTYGHTTGDAVLRLVARTLTANIKGRDVVARYGGEEFAIIFPRTAATQAMNVVKQILVAVQGMEMVAGPRTGPPPRVTVSGGVAAHEVNDTAVDFINRADAALYEAKRTGRNRVVLAPPG